MSDDDKEDNKIINAFDAFVSFNAYHCSNIPFIVLDIIKRRFWLHNVLKVSVL